MNPKIKICCISSIAEANMALSYGASAIGLVGKMPSGPGPIEDDLIKSIAITIPPPIGTFLLTCETSAEQIITHHKRTFTNTIQLVDELPEKDYAVLNKSGRTAEADAAMKAAMPLANMQELHQYGRQLLQQKKAKEALEVFKLNAQKNPNNFTTYMGLARGLSATGDYKTALKNVQLALPLAPNKPSKDIAEDMKKKLSEGRDVN